GSKLRAAGGSVADEPSRGVKPPMNRRGKRRGRRRRGDGMRVTPDQAIQLSKRGSNGAIVIFQLRGIDKESSYDFSEMQHEFGPREDGKDAKSNEEPVPASLHMLVGIGCSGVCR